MTDASKKERFYKLVDEYSLETILVMLIAGCMVGLAVFFVLDSAEDTPDQLNLTDLNEEYRENATCVPPYRDKACYPSENVSGVNTSVNDSGGTVDN